MNVRAFQRGRTRGAVLLLGVMVLVVSATLAAIGLVVEVTSRDLAGASDRRVHHARAAAGSLIAALASELEEQREALLGGGEAGVGNAESLTIAGPGGAWVARVSGGELVSENARLDVNAVPASVLERLGGLESSDATAIVGARPHRGVRGAAEAAGVDATAEWLDLVTVWSAEPALTAGLESGQYDQH